MDRSRSENGFSLVAVVAMGAVVGTWMLFLTGLVLPSYYKAAQSRYYNVLRSTAEAGLDYAISQLNAAIPSGGSGTLTPSTLDATALGSSTTSTVPSSAINVSGASVKVTVQNIAPPSTSAIYNSSYDYKAASPPLEPATGGTTAGNGWRIVTATSQYAPPGNPNGLVYLTKSIRVVLQPTYNSSGSITTGTPYFTYAIMSAGLIGISNSYSTDGYNSSLGAYGGANVDPYGGSIGSNASISLSNSAKVGGSVYVNYVPPVGTALGTTFTQGNSSTIQDMLVINGNASGTTATPGANPGGSDNVLGLGGPEEGQTSEPRVNYNSYSRESTPIIENGVSGSQTGVQYNPSTMNPEFSIPAAPTAPAGSYDVGSITVSNTGNVVVKVGAPAPTGAINVSSGTVYIPPGNYNVTSFSMSNSSTFTIDSSVGALSTPMPFAMYIQGGSTGSTVFQVSNKAQIQNNTSTPANFQVFYGGTKNITFGNASNFYGTVYAPNAPVNLSNSFNFYGAIVCGNTSPSNHGMVHFDKALANTTTASKYNLTYSNSTPVQLLLGFRAVSWQEE